MLNATAVNDASYGDFAGYLELPTADYTLQVRTADNSAIVATYAAPLQTLGLQGAALTVYASGFLNPAVNSNGPAFGLWVALPAGGALVELPLVANPTARVQVIHNSADLAAATVDVWLNNTLLLDNFAFRTASPFVDAPATIDFNVGIAPANSTNSADAIANFTYNLEEGGTYIITANGIVSATGYSPVQPFNLYVNADAREAANTAGNTDILVFHGCTDAPVVDVAETAVLGGTTVVNDLAYGIYTDYLEVPAADYVLQVRTADGTPLVSYQAPLATLGLANAAITVLASGFLDPMMNSNGASFGLWVALASGGALVELPLATGVNENDADLSALSAWPNPANDLVNISFDAVRDVRTAIAITDLSGRVVLEVGSVQLQQGANRLAVDVAGLNAGVYQLSISNENGRRILPLQVVR